MSMNTYNPDYAIHPGEILAETIEARNILKQDIAKRCNITPKAISEIINGKIGISADLALSFEKVLGISANVWNNLQANFKLFEARKREKQETLDLIDWVKTFPIRELMKRGFLAKVKMISLDTVRELLRFFGVSSREAWNKTYQGYVSALYRRSDKFETSIESIITYIVLGMKEANQIETKPYDKATFIECIRKIREIVNTKPEYFEKQIKELCKAAGVAIVFIPELPKTRISGVTDWLNSEKALIIMSLRYKTEDQFWFTLFHEFAHILLHSKKEAFIDQIEKNGTDKEREANTFATEVLVDKKQYNDFIKNNDFSENAIIDFAESINSTPGIIIGRLQHDNLISYKHYLSKLKRRFTIEQ